MVINIIVSHALCYSLQPGHYSNLTAPNLQPTANQERNDQAGNQHYSRELLMMGIIVPEICWTYKKHNKIISGIQLVSILVWSKLFFSLLGPVSSGFALYSNIGIQVVWGSVWQVRTAESKAYLREYNVVGFRWCTCSCDFTWIYIGKLDTVSKIMSHFNILLTVYLKIFIY